MYRYSQFRYTVKLFFHRAARSKREIFVREFEIRRTYFWREAKALLTISRKQNLRHLTPHFPRRPAGNQKENHSPIFHRPFLPTWHPGFRFSSFVSCIHTSRWRFSRCDKEDGEKSCYASNRTQYLYSRCLSNCHVTKIKMQTHNKRWLRARSKYGATTRAAWYIRHWNLHRRARCIAEITRRGYRSHQVRKRRRCRSRIAMELRRNTSTMLKQFAVRIVRMLGVFLLLSRKTTFITSSGRNV